jgi:nitric oxide reductase NorD protein
MEEYVGQLWDRWITQVADRRHAGAAVMLEEVSRAVGVLFRAFGGDGGLRVEAATAGAHGARRTWVQRLAGTGGEVALAWRDAQTLRLPARIDVFPERALNRDLYLWLAALAAANDVDPELPWLVRNQRGTVATLARYPGMIARYRRLVQAQIALRPDPASLPAAEAAQERAIRHALSVPGAVVELPSARRPLAPVHLWLHPHPPMPAAMQPAPADEGEDCEENPGGGVKNDKTTTRRRAERVEPPARGAGLLLFRFESIFSWAEYTRVDRGVDDEEDNDAAARAAADLDVLSVTRDRNTTAARLRVDLDLPAAGNDDMALGEGILLPEWDYRKRRPQADHCRILPMVAAQAAPCELPPHLRASARRLRGQFQALTPQRVWFSGQADGVEPDLDAYLRFAATRASGAAVAPPGMYRDFRGGRRDLACLLLADLSLSTDAWVSNEARVIDVIRDSLFLFAEALNASGDAFAMYGFSSRRRDNVRVHALKEFHQRYDAQARGRVQAVKPGFYTRMGAAVRYATQLLGHQGASQRLLLLLTDGKPNDLDVYEGRYGAEDTRMALIEARRAGIQPFCVTVDEEANDYLPHIFGPGAFVVIRKPAELPTQLPLLYARLTRS